MSFERQRAQMRAQLAGTLSVVGLLTLIAIGATLLITRRLVAPMRRLMRAARAVGAGKLDVYVPARSSDELGLLTHAFNHMTHRLSESQAEVANYQRTLEDKVAQRTKELEIATAHAYKLAQHDILTGLPNRSLLNQRLRQIARAAQHGTHVVPACSSTSTTSSGSTTRSGTTRATSCSRRSRSGSAARCGSPTPSRAWAVTSSCWCCPASTRRTRRSR
jgi:nitrate/nitrite-specific signal transduction histidine kinase